MFKQKKKIILFFSRGTSLSIWVKSGLFDREIEPYKKYTRTLYEVSFLTYGKNDDAKFVNQLNPIEILYNRFKLPVDVFSLLCPFIYRKQLKQSDLYKTHQINGWWAAGLAKLLYRKPLLVRCGYLLSTNQEQPWKNYSSIRIKLVSLLEKLAFLYADAIIVTTPQMKSDAIKRHKLPTEKITVIPNTVDINVFKPIPEIEKIKGRIGFVGKFTPQKNIHLLIEAVSGMKDTSVILIGNGPLKSEIECKAKSIGLNVTFLGNVPNYSLPELLNTCEAFVLPSEWEGMPKSLIEAMACGIPVIGTDVAGIRDIIKHGKNGYLCKPEVVEIRNAINSVMGNKQLRQTLGNNARKFIVENYSLEGNLHKEIKLSNDLVKYAYRNKRRSPIGYN